MIISLIICACVYYHFEYPKINLYMKLENKNIIDGSFIKETSLIKEDINLVKGIFKTNNIIKANSLENSICNNKIELGNQILDIQAKDKNVIDNTSKNAKENIWKLEIPKIGLVANIAEGTSGEILNVYIGHFEETQKKDGNIGLAAHNRGYPVNYFNRLKELEVGDEIIYTYLGKSQKYEVIQSSIIEDTNWKVLENTGDNRLTLITCVENEPTLRRCVQAIEKI